MRWLCLPPHKTPSDCTIPSITVVDTTTAHFAFHIPPEGWEIYEFDIALNRVCVCVCVGGSCAHSSHHILTRANIVVLSSLMLYWKITRCGLGRCDEDQVKWGNRLCGSTTHSPPDAAFRSQQHREHSMLYICISIYLFQYIHFDIYSKSFIK